MTSALLKQGVNSKLAAASQLTSVSSTGALNLAFLLIGRDSFVAYGLATAPALLIMNAIDPGVNQEILHGCRPNQAQRIKLLSFTLASTLVLVVGVTRSTTPSIVASTVLYVACYTVFTYHLALLWRLRLFLLEVYIRLTFSICILGLLALALMFHAWAIQIVLCGQAVTMLALALVSRLLRRNHESMELPTNTENSPMFKTLLVAAQRCAILNIVSNGFIVAAGLIGASQTELASVRISTVAAMTAVALTPVGPQHFPVLPAARRALYLKTLRIFAAVLAGVGLIVIAVSSVDTDGHLWISALLGAGAGCLVSESNLRISSVELTPMRGTLILAGCLISAIAAAAISLALPFIATFVGSLFIYLFAQLCFRSSKRSSLTAQQLTPLETTMA
jgi:hypothetical protein